MPAKYEAIRDSLVKKGTSLKSAKTQAAKIFNSTRGKGPTLNSYVKKEKGK